MTYGISAIMRRWEPVIVASLLICTIDRNAALAQSPPAIAAAAQSPAAQSPPAPSPGAQSPGAQSDDASPAKPPATTDPSAVPKMGNGNANQGVIAPPPVGDSTINKPPPPTTAFPMPVIPPPGSPGGNPNVKPK
jgi:hypothetical protein